MTHRRAEMSHEELRWDESVRMRCKEWRKVRWDEMRWSVECAVGSTKCRLAMRRSCAWIRTKIRTKHARTRLAGAGRLQVLTKKVLVRITLRQLPPRLVRVLLVRYIYNFIYIVLPKKYNMVHDIHAQYSSIPILLYTHSVFTGSFFCSAQVSSPSPCWVCGDAQNGLEWLL